MTVRFRLFAIILFVALVPLAVSALTALRIHERALDARTTELHRKTAELGAAGVHGYLDGASRSLRLLVQGTIRWGELTPAERDGALWVAYRQLDDIAVVALLDEHGRGIGPSVYVDTTDVAPALAAHPRASAQLLERFAGRIPFDATRRADVALGRPFPAGAAGEWILPLAIAVRGPATGPRWVVAVGLSLRTVCATLLRDATADLGVSLLDAGGVTVCGRGAEPPATVREQEPGRAPATRMARYRAADGQEMLAAAAPAGESWTVVTQQPARVAFAATRRIRRQALFWLVTSFFVTLAAGLFLARSISRPVRRLVAGTREFTAGNFSHRLVVEGRDEFTRLSHAFNDMGQEIERRDAEIRRWNEELQERVAQRSRELKETQEQLLHSQKMAAMSSLGAGIGHEINNPLTSVLGIAQVLLERARRNPAAADQVKFLTALEDEAQRIRKIVETLRSLTESYGGDGFASVDLRGVVGDAQRLVADRCATQGVTVAQSLAPDAPPVIGNQLQLQQVLLQLYDNALKAMPQGGRLTTSVASVDGVVRVVVEDTGRGIEPEHLDKIFDPFFTTKTDWKGAGLGLTVAFRVIEQHHGSIKATSAVGQGTAVTINLPPARTGTYLV